MHRIQPPPEQENPQTSRSTDQLHIARNQVRRRSRRRISEFSAAERLYRPWVASAQLYSGVGKCWLLLLCYGEALRRLDLCLRRYRGAFGRSKASFLGPASEGPSEGEKGPYSCPLPISSPLCCADALFCATSGVLPPASDWGNPLSALRKKSGDGSSSPPTSSSSSVSLACGIDADSSAYILGPIDPMDSSRNESLAGCCRSRYSTPFEEPGQKEPPQLPSGAKGGAPGGVERGPELGIRRCCNPEVDLRTYPSSSTPCEFSARCKVASKPGLGCCAHAAASNATGSTPLTASLAWRPLGIGGVNALASCVLTLRGAVAYSREVLGWRVQTPHDFRLFGRPPATLPRVRETQASCWSTAHATALATVCVVLVWSAFIPFWWDLDVAYYKSCHPHVLGEWAGELARVVDYWRATVRLDAILTSLHLLADIVLTRACLNS
mmetsp:Transcript_61316/g.138793  ORF Transcript_61316/g.138793 Transcript_61316/m.138793 type:complete len:439 (-) Transcript_61316:143-1459(-)